MKRFLITISIGIAIPLVTLIAIYLWTDPFRCLHAFDINDVDITNREYLSTELFLRNEPIYHYNSFIFSSSRGGGMNTYQSIDSKNFYFIPFVAPPGHLQITSHAHIGVLSYVPASNTGYSVLNTLYCAPNKIYEFSQFGIPMIGNDNPGLRYLFNTENIGEIFEEWTEDSICAAIKRIEKNYRSYSENAKQFFNKTNVREQIEKLLSAIE